MPSLNQMDPTHSAESSNSTPGDTAQQSGNLSLERRYHPSYPYRVDNLAGDLVLLSKDDVQFHVHSIILKFASSFFREMLEIPRTSLESAEDPIPLEEDAEIIAAMLDVIYPYSILREEATKRAVDLFAEELIAAADKYDMLAISAAVKKALFTRTGNVPSLNDKWSAIRRFDLACRHQWEEEAKLAASWTLHWSLTTPESLSDLQRVSSRSILRLQKLHRDRIQAFLDSLGTIAHSCRPMVGCCTGQLTISDAWQHFIYTIVKELNQDPLASRLSDDSTWDTPGYFQIFAIKHDGTCRYFNSILFSKIDFIDKVRMKLDSLPTSIY